MDGGGVMSEKRNGRPGAGRLSRKHLRCARLFLLLVWIPANAPVARASGGQAPDATPPPQQQSAAHDAQEVTTLEPGTPVERELSGGHRHGYRVSLSAGEHVKVVIRQRGINASVGLRVPGGETLSVFEAVTTPDVLEISRVAKTPGTYQIDVSAPPLSPAGRYEIRIAELRPATEADREMQLSRDLWQEYWRLHRAGRYQEARPFILRAIEIRERVAGPEALGVASLLGNLATSYTNTGDYASAEPLRLRELKIVEKALGADHPATASALARLAGLYRRKGDHLKAEESSLRALAVFERSQRLQSPEVAVLLNSLAELRLARGDYAGAEEYAGRSRAVLEKLFGPEHFHLADSYSFSGRVAFETGDYARAEAMFGHALALAEKALGSDHLSVTGYRNDLAAVYAATGREAEAEALYGKALAAHERKSAMSAPAVLDTLYGLARLHAARGRADEAVRLMARAGELEERYVGTNLAAGSERERLAFLDKLSLLASRTISLHARLAPADAAARDLAVTTVLRRKGRVLDALSEGRAALRLRLGPEERALLDRLDDATSRLARLSLGGPQHTTPAEHAARLRALEEERERLESELSFRSAGLYERPRPVTLDAVRREIPAGAALVEFASYLPFDPRAPGEKGAYAAPRYIAYVVPREGEVRWKELGATREIDAAVVALRRALRDPSRRDARSLARSVDETVMRPLRALAGGAEQLLLSPDGGLNLLPFAALVDERGRYLVERYSLTYLTSGRDLLRARSPRESRGGPVVVAAPAFGDPAAAAHAGGADGAPRFDYSRLFFGPLPGVTAEVRALRELWPEATFLTGERATKESLKRLSGPSILHVATHGFFLSGDPPGGVAPRGADESRAGRVAAGVPNPLLRSGLALAGANRSGAGGADGLLTAFEMSGLDLWGTKLVVLSACDTGLGEVRGSEGVYGLRRALVLAGAESQLLSLWAVPDRATRDLMIGYYQGLARGEGRGEALRRVQLRMLAGGPHAHPYYWAAFIQAGEWANLKGER